MMAVEKPRRGRRWVRPTRKLPPGWATISLEEQAKAIAERYERERELRYERWLGIQEPPS